MTNLYDRIIKYCIYLLVFLMPLWFFPFSFEQFEFGKQYLLYFLSSIAFLAWLGKMIVVDKKIRFKKTLLDIPILIFVLITILSAIFSIDKHSSLFGFYGRFSDGLIALISCAMLYFVITNNVSSKEQEASIKQESIVRTFLFSSFLVVLTTYFSLLGIWQKLNNSLITINPNLGLPQMMLEKGFNPAAKSMQGLAMFLVLVVILLVTTILLSEKRKAKNPLLIINYLLLTGIVGLMLIIDFGSAWAMLLLTLSIFVAFALRKRLFKKDVRKLLLPILLISIAGISLIINYQLLITDARLPQELILSQSNSWKIGLWTLVDSPKNLFVGSGIGTFFHDFIKEKPLNLNKTQLWQIRYDRGGNHIAEIIATTGLFGLLSYSLVVVVTLMVSSAFLSSNNKQLPLFMGFIALVIGQFVYYENMILSFMFWLLLGLLMVGWRKPAKEKIFSFEDFAELSLVFNVSLILISLLLVGTFYYGLRFYYADIAYAQAEAQPVSREKTNLIERAVKLNPIINHYQIILTRAYLDEISLEINQTLSEEESIFLQQKISKAIDSSKKATELSPNNVVGWETLGVVYREIRGMASGALDWGIKAFEKAIELDPTNPVLHTELGKLYLVSGRNEEAQREFDKAIEVKSDYIDALIQRSLLYEREEKSNEAIEYLEELTNNYPLNIDILFQLGRLYYNNDQVSEAILQLEKAIRLSPNHSNALYSLGIAYEANGENRKAINVLERVLELNPGNVDIQQKLEELRK